MDNKKQQATTINIELNEEVAEGIYSNLAIISHSNAEFVIDFVRLLPNIPKAKVKSRIILPPQHAKRFMRAMIENVKKYEAQYGVIQESDQMNIPPMHFSPPKGEA